jgi:hypothetical protein
MFSGSAYLKAPRLLPGGCSKKHPNETLPDPLRFFDRLWVQGKGCHQGRLEGKKEELRSVPGIIISAAVISLSPKIQAGDKASKVPET